MIQRIVNISPLNYRRLVTYISSNIFTNAIFRILNAFLGINFRIHTFYLSKTLESTVFLEILSHI